MIKIIENKNTSLDAIEEIGPATKVNLINAGIESVKDLVVRGPNNISETTGISIEKAVELCNKARIKLEESGDLEKSFITATELYNKRQNIARISTGSRCL
ncbi:MAG: helix-hairpin-helix domain-containing protein, partial [Nitrososphaeraceae archaeon]|nr:helix-hairpin-helix domain-containing protein [Nitrososphaeraceae archaeon]